MLVIVLVVVLKMATLNMVMRMRAMGRMEMLSSNIMVATILKTVAANLLSFSPAPLTTTRATMVTTTTATTTTTTTVLLQLLLLFVLAC